MLAQDLRTRGAKKGAQSAIRLAEIGPRMTLRLVKVEAGLADGDVLYHAFIKKTAEESRNLKRKHEEADRLRTERREEQERNVQLKKAKLAEKKARKLERRKARKEAAEAAFTIRDMNALTQLEIKANNNVSLLELISGYKQKLQMGTR